MGTIIPLVTIGGKEEMKFLKLKRKNQRKKKDGKPPKRQGQGTRVV